MVLAWYGAVRTNGASCFMTVVEGFADLLWLSNQWGVNIAYIVTSEAFIRILGLHRNHIYSSLWENLYEKTSLDNLVDAVDVEIWTIDMVWCYDHFIILLHRLICCKVDHLNMRRDSIKYVTRCAIVPLCVPINLGILWAHLYQALGFSSHGRFSHA